MINLLKPTGNHAIDEALVEAIHLVEKRLPDAQLSYYLHGSWAAAAATPQSDIDVLALARGQFSEQEREAAKALAARVAKSRGLPIDFHIHALASLIADPYVDLRRTGMRLYGTDLRPLLPEPTLDALARESISISLQYVTAIRRVTRVSLPMPHPSLDDPFFGRLGGKVPAEHAKTLIWLASARLAAVCGYAPTSAADALKALANREDDLGRWVVEAVRQCRSAVGSLPTTETLRTLCAETLVFENETLSSVVASIKEGRLGARCAEVARRYLNELT